VRTPHCALRITLRSAHCALRTAHCAEGPENVLNRAEKRRILKSESAAFRPGQPVSCQLSVVSRQWAVRSGQCAVTFRRIQGTPLDSRGPLLVSITSLGIERHVPWIDARDAGRGRHPPLVSRAICQNVFNAPRRPRFAPGRLDAKPADLGCSRPPSGCRNRPEAASPPCRQAQNRTPGAVAPCSGQP